MIRINKILRTRLIKSNSTKILSLLSKIYFIIYNKKKVKGTQNRILFPGAFIKKSIVTIKGNNNLIQIGSGSIFDSVNINIKGNDHRLTFNKHCRIRNLEFWFEDNNCKISVGKNSAFYGGHIAVTEPNSEIEIGENCLFSSEIDIRNGDSHSIIDLNTNKRINYAKNIIIGNKVWIGKYCQILKGAIIEDNCIVGIRSLVNTRIPKNTLAVGTPAKVIKSNVTWEIERIYDREV
jgi:acetyltransferase-like isoleucine patch superfamily enzyme